MAGSLPAFARQFEGLGPVYAQYPARLQLEVLSLDPGKLPQPVLDLGCGPDHLLLNELWHQGLTAGGCDLLAQPGPGLVGRNWFDLPLPGQCWGTVISHMAFSRHFIAEHLNRRGHPAGYAHCYRSVLQALAPGGSFVYAPGLPFVEEYLPSGFRLETNPLPSASPLATRAGACLSELLGRDVFYSARVTRLKGPAG